MEPLIALYHWFISIPWRTIYRVIKEIFIFLDVLILIGIIMSFIKALEFRPKFVFNPYKITKKTIFKNPEMIKRWQTLIEKSKINPPQSFVLAIIEADKFTDDALRQMGLRGEHMADRLERLSSEDLKTLDKLWRVHKIRNELVHTPDFEIKPHDAEDILHTYETFLKEVEIL